MMIKGCQLILSMIFVLDLGCKSTGHVTNEAMEPHAGSKAMEPHASKKAENTNEEAPARSEPAAGSEEKLVLTEKDCLDAVYPQHQGQPARVSPTDAALIRNVSIVEFDTHKKRYLCLTDTFDPEEDKGIFVLSLVGHEGQRWSQLAALQSERFVESKSCEPSEELGEDWCDSEGYQASIKTIPLSPKKNGILYKVTKEQTNPESSRSESKIWLLRLDSMNEVEHLLDFEETNEEGGGGNYYKYHTIEAQKQTTNGFFDIVVTTTNNETDEEVISVRRYRWNSDSNAYLLSEP